MDEHIAIRVKNLSKRYTIGAQKSDSLRHSLGDVFRKKKSSKEEFWALRDVNFEIQKGDVVGIIGKNGAGKSTLLKILSQITKPTEGSIEINGRIASLLEVGTGFHHELTGRENIYLNGTILGMTRKEVTAKFDEIVEFSGVGKFIDTPVKHYSSGMYVRLAFSVAAHLEPEILVVDEVLAVGDSEFQKKCLGKMQDVAGKGRTVIFVSHDLVAVKQLCKNGIFLSKGNVEYIGSIDKVIDKYISNRNYDDYSVLPNNKQPSITKVNLITSEGGGLQSHGKPLKIKIVVHVPQGRTGMALSFQILNSLGAPVLYNWIFDDETPICRTDGEHEFEFSYDALRLYEGMYSIRVHLAESNNVKEKFEQLDLCNFEVCMLHDPIPEWGWQKDVCVYFDSGKWEQRGTTLKIQDQKTKTLPFQ